MKANNRRIGQLTESAAAEYLSNHGYQIIERNFSNRFGEIDIIVKEKNILIFVEVKAKTGIEFGLPEEMITKGKLSKIRRMANLYMQDKILPCRIDVVAIVLDRNETITRLTHYQNVY
jgi:putative endonuclease